MNLQEAKTLFIAQHHGQKCVISGNEFTIQGHIIDGVYNGIDCYIPVRSVDQLTDDELIMVASIVCSRHNRHYQESEISYKISKKRRFDIVLIVKGIARYIVQLDSDGIGFVDYYLGGAGSIHHFAPGQYAATDYIRSIGILLPFTYPNEDNKPITLQPAEIIALGWAKYKTENEHQIK